MGIDYAGCWADVMEWTDIAEIVPREAAALERNLKAAGMDIDQFCRAEAQEEWEYLELEVKGKRTIAEAIAQIKDAWSRLSAAFAQATAVDGAGLTVEPGYHDPEQGERGDEVVDGFFHVEGVYQLTPAGKRFANKIERLTFVEFG